MNVLISLHPGYGLGDAVQMSTVLRHVVAAHPDWAVDYCAEEGKHQVGRGIVENTFVHRQTLTSRRYDAEFMLVLYETWYGWSDRPNTRVSSCLHERFGLPWLPEHGRYRVDVSPEVQRWATDIVSRKAVAVHYQGDSAWRKKNLTNDQAESICSTVREVDYMPYILGRHIPKGHDAEVNCALIAQCAAFVGIDSGPAKCASATDTPSLVVWTGHHPAQFHDPAPNTTHLVPRGYHSLEPVRGDPDITGWFEAHYSIIEYTDGDPVPQIRTWLGEVLR